MAAWIVISLGWVGCADGPGIDANCRRLWSEATSCWQDYCTIGGGNRLFCECLQNGGKNLDAETCSCSGGAEDKFLASCMVSDEVPGPDEAFDCDAEWERLHRISAERACCRDTADCGQDQRCTERRCTNF